MQKPSCRIERTDHGCCDWSIPYTGMMHRGLVTMAAAVVLVGCAATPLVSEDPLGFTPEDFSLDVTVLTGSGAEIYPQAHLRQSRFVLMPNGSLHFGVDADRTRGSNWLPDVVRTLDRRQVQEVWSLARQLGLTDPGRGDGRVNFDLVKAPPEHVVYLAAFTGDDEAWSFIRSGTAAHPDPALTSLTRLLARLSWASDVEAQAAAVMPTRYNFGPDPYARYRSSAASQPGAAP
jgi:hypothetical protein